MNIMLNASGQSQLSQLKAMNNLPLQRIDAKRQAVTQKQSAVTNLNKAAEAVKTSLTSMRSADATVAAAATKEFVQKFNDLQNALKVQTDKGAALNLVSSARQARSDLRTPMQDMDVLSALKDVGVSTTREGLTVATTTPTVTQLTDKAFDALMGNMTKITTKFSSTLTQESSKMTALDAQRLRAQRMIDSANVRTEQNFIKMYNTMQNMSGGNGSAIINSFN